MSDIESESGIVSIYITPMSLPEKMGINLKNYCLIPSGVLKMPDKLQKYPRLYCFKIFLPNSTPKGSHIKPFIFIYNNPLNQ